MFNEATARPGKTRVLIAAAEHSARRMLSQVLHGMPEVTLVGFVRDAEHVATRTALSTPDLLLLHAGFAHIVDALADLRQQTGVSVLLWGESSQRGQRMARSAAAGEILLVPDGSGDSQEQAAQERLIVCRIRELCQASPRQALPARDAVAASDTAAPRQLAAPRKKLRPQAVVVGSSTGGPVALTTFIEMLPPDFPLPIAIVQHMPAMFTSLLAERLNSISPLEIREGTHDMEFASGRVIIGPGGLHMRLERDATACRVRLDSGPPENSCRPAVDVLFRSAAGVFGGAVLTVVLTGMGKDGLLGSEHLRRLGSPVIVQDAATSTVWGMPGAIAQAGLADAVLPLPQIVPELMRYL